MPIRKTLSVTLFAGTALILAAAAALAQDKVAPEDADAVTDGRADRYSLVAVDGDILRVDRQNGTVTVCRNHSDFWRCNPVPLAEDAYLAEINDLSAEVDRLKEQLAALESDDEGSSPVPEAGDETSRSDGGLGTGEDPSGTKKKLDMQDEELERVLTFTESAMRRFFGMVRDLQKEFNEEGKN